MERGKGEGDGRGEKEGGERERSRCVQFYITEEKEKSRK